jgi:hypothetical protein
MKFSAFSSQCSVVCGFATILGIACNKPPAVNMLRDDSITQSEWSTPSQDGILNADKPAMIRVRELPQTPAPLACEEVPHYPLWWEDPFEDKGDGNQQFSWTLADVAATPYSLARYILNTIAWPVSAIVTLPGEPMVSDGQLSRGLLGYDHDAARGNSPNPQASADDFGFETAQTAPAP